MNFRTYLFMHFLFVLMIIFLFKDFISLKRSLFLCVYGKFLVASRRPDPIISAQIKMLLFLCFTVYELLWVCVDLSTLCPSAAKECSMFWTIKLPSFKIALTFFYCQHFLFYLQAFMLTSSSTDACITKVEKLDIYPFLVCIPFLLYTPLLLHITLEQKQPSAVISSGLETCLYLR